MNKLLLTLMTGAAIVFPLTAWAEEPEAHEHELPVEIRVFDKVIFYDGYQMKNIPEDCPDDGVLRHYTYHCALPLADEDLDKIGEKLHLDVLLTAACDNYDRIGNVNLAFVPKGSTSYTLEDEGLERIEIARFITPFMNKNLEPTEVPYHYNISWLSDLLRDKNLRAEKDIWMELEIFGIPYAANTQVDGCAGRQDTFLGTVCLSTDETPLGPSERNVLVPIYIKKPEYVAGGNLNKYASTDVEGECIRSLTFTVPEDVTEGQLVVITSNHGANQNGEEYNRRWHSIYFDDEFVWTYRPGRDSCEPFRKYNTQANGIYTTKVKSEVYWQSFSNWCPGDVIDIRLVNLEAVKAGEHKFTIEVAGTRFIGDQGDIPFSVYFQGVKEGKILTQVEELIEPEQVTEFRIDGGRVWVDNADPIRNISVYTPSGVKLKESRMSNSVSVESLGTGIYVLVVEYDNGMTEGLKLAL